MVEIVMGVICKVRLVKIKKKKKKKKKTVFEVGH